jgi:hypothetical protein
MWQIQSNLMRFFGKCPKWCENRNKNFHFKQKSETKFPGRFTWITKFWRFSSCSVMLRIKSVINLNYTPFCIVRVWRWCLSSCSNSRKGRERERRKKNERFAYESHRAMDGFFRVSFSPRLVMGWKKKLKLTGSWLVWIIKCKVIVRVSLERWKLGWKIGRKFENWDQV